MTTVRDILIATDEGLESIVQTMLLIDFLRMVREDNEVLDRQIIFGDGSPGLVGGMNITKVWVDESHESKIVIDTKSKRLRKGERRKMRRDGSRWA